MTSFRLGVALVTGALLLSACSDAPPESQPAPAAAPPPAVEAVAAPSGPQTVRIVEPVDGASVVGPNVTVRFEVTGLRVVEAGVMEAGTGHHHLFLDVDLTPLNEAIPVGLPGILHFGLAQTETVLEGVAPGEHRLIAVVADGAHVPLNPPVVDTIVFTVTAPAN